MCKRTCGCSQQELITVGQNIAILKPCMYCNWMTCLKSLQLWDTVGWLAEKNHTETHKTLFIKVIKIVQLCVISCGWNPMKVCLCGEAVWRWYVCWLSLARGPPWIVTACSAEWWSDWSMRQHGWAVERGFFLLDVSRLFPWFGNWSLLYWSPALQPGLLLAGWRDVGVA